MEAWEKVEIELFSGQYAGSTVCSDFTPNFEPSQVASAQASTSKKKFLLSTFGDTTITKERPRLGTHYREGAYLGPITLHYCSALGMMEVGVLPKTDIWAYNRAKRPATSGLRFNPPCKKIRDPMNPSKLVDLVDLTE